MIFGPAPIVAAVFAVHPLRVESVAWVAERKDVLSGLLFVLTLWAYVGYARRRFSLIRYSLVATTFAFGLMAKPVLVTLPLVLLLLDYWPLGRVAGTLRVPSADSSPDRQATSHGLCRLFAEKIPLLVLTAASCLATSVAQAGSMMGLELMPLDVRIKNAVVSYAAVFGQVFLS